MKRIIIALAALLAVSTAAAQTEETLDPDFGGRLAVSMDKKLVRGLHLRLEEEVRFDNAFASFNRFHTTLGLSYKLNKYLKLGAGYALINPYNSDSGAFKSARHRFMVDATASVRFGSWRLSLKERFQATYRSGDMNEYQNPRTALTLKSRLKLQYKGFQRFEPYAALELRNTLNAPVINANYNGTYYLTDGLSRTGEPGWFIDSWTGCYVNRLRGSLGFEYSFSRASAVDVSLLADYVMDRVVDANAEGTRLKSYTYESGFIFWITAGYTYSF